MTFNININQLKALEWNLSIKASICMSKFIDLSTWATAVIVDGKTYYVLYRKKLLEEIPLIGTSLTTASKIIKELEEKEIIESIHKNTTPAYRLTNKGRGWISDTKFEKPNDAEKKPNDGENKKFTFRLKRELEYDDLSEEYQNFLKIGCLKYAEQNNLQSSEYDDFINQKKSKGISHKDWASAFKTWCSNAKKFGKTGQKNNSNGGEKNTLVGMEL